MQAWLFYDNQDFWKPPQIQVFNLIPHAFFHCICLLRDMHCI